jgi:catechol 2,3-dioxygenase-like lactoylglutathione lyase family enzyme
VLPAAVHVVTLGAHDLSTLRDFYERLGWRLAIAVEDFAAFETGGAVLTLFPLDRLAADGRVPAPAPTTEMRGVTLGIIVRAANEVDEAIEVARRAGARITKEPVAAAEFEGRHAHFADPEGNLWEVVWLGEGPRAGAGMAGLVTRASGSPGAS